MRAFCRMADMVAVAGVGKAMGKWQVRSPSPKGPWPWDVSQPDTTWKAPAGLLHAEQSCPASRQHVSRVNNMCLRMQACAVAGSGGGAGWTGGSGGLLVGQAARPGQALAGTSHFDAIVSASNTCSVVGGNVGNGYVTIALLL